MYGIYLGSKNGYCSERTDTRVMCYAQNHFRLEALGRNYFQLLKKV